MSSHRRPRYRPAILRRDCSDPIDIIEPPPAKRQCPFERFPPNYAAFVHNFDSSFHGDEYNSWRFSYPEEVSLSGAVSFDDAHALQFQEDWDEKNPQ